MWVAEVGPDAESFVDLVVAGELGSVVDGEASPHPLWQGPEHIGETLGGGFGQTVWRADQGGHPRGPLVQHEGLLAILREQHEVGFPVAGLKAIGGGGGTFVDGYPMLDVQGGAAALARSPAALELGPGQITALGEVVGAPDLGVDEAIDGLVADHRLAQLSFQPAGDLNRRPAPRQSGQHLLAQGGATIQLRA